jgi:RimJ/RimL family protein N-acetyltransferase
MAHWAKILSDETLITKAILVDGQVAGNIVSWAQFGEREVGYWIGKEYWGKGVATKTLAAFLGDISARPLYAHVAKHNIGSRRVLEKCGFIICGEDRLLADASGEQVEELILTLVVASITTASVGADWPVPILSSGAVRPYAAGARYVCGHQCHRS